MRKLLCILLLLLAGNADAALRYVRAGAGGAGTGADWTDAYTALPDTLVRGDTYYIADGSYGTYFFDTALSGTTTITLKKATVADHGTSTGWSDTYGDGVATFNELKPVTGYLVVNGQTRNESDWTDPVYGFRISAIWSISINGENGNHSSFSYCEVGGAYSLTPVQGMDVSIKLVYAADDYLFSRCYVHNYTGTGWQLAGARNITIEYCFIGPGWGKEAIRGGNYNDSDNFTIRYNKFWNATATYPFDSTTGITAEIAIWDVGNIYSGHEIYGNWFYNQNQGGRNSVIMMGYPGLGEAQNCKIYNNTFVGIAESAVYPMIYTTGSGNEARNNLFYNCVDTDISVNTAANNYTITTNAFWNYNNLDFRLVGPVPAGGALSAPYNTDPIGNTRGQDGWWDVGAFEYGGAQQAPDITSGNSLWTNGVSGSYSITVSGGASSYGATNLPAGLSVSVASGNINGTPTATVTNTVGLFATNSSGFDVATVTFTVLPQAPVLGLSDVSLSFGLIPTNTTATATFNVRNDGPAGTTLSGSVSNVNGSAFSLLTSPATYSLAGGASKTYTLRYAPTSIGTNHGTVAVNGNHASNFVAMSGLAFPVFTGTNWVLTNALVLAPMVKDSANYLATTQALSGTPATTRAVAVWGYNQAAQTTGTFWGTLIATNVTGGSSIAVDAVSSEHVENVTANETTPHTQGALTDGYIVASVGLWSSGDFDVSAATYDGSAMVLLAAHNLDLAQFGEYRVQIYGLAVGNKAGGTYNFVAQPTGQLGHYNSGIVSLNNVRQADSSGTAVDGVGTGTTASLTVSSAAGELVFLAAIRGNSAGAPDSGETELVDTQPEADAESQFPDVLWLGSEPGAASVNIAVDFTGSEAWAATAIPIRATTNYGVNSLLFSVNAWPNDPTNLWPVIPKATNWGVGYIHQVGTGTVTAPQYYTNEFVLGTSNVFFLQTRETDTKIRELNYEANAEAGADETDPVVTITAPTELTVSETPLTTLAGTASDNVAITAMTCTNTTTGVGFTVDGIGTWTVASLDLQAGENVIVVYATDAAANEGTDSITITYSTTVPAISTVQDLRAYILQTQ